MSTKGPPLEDGEEVVFDHIPSLAAFRKTALILLAATLLPTIVFAVVFPDSFWVAVPLFVSCVILMQERATFGKYRAWITNQRIILQNGRAVMLWDVLAAVKSGNGVRVRHSSNMKGIKLYYPEDPAKLISAITSAQKAPA